MDNNDLEIGFSSSIEYLDEDNERSNVTVFCNQSGISEVLEHLFNTAIKLKVNPNQVISINVARDILFRFVENRFTMKESMFETVLKQWRYLQKRKEKENADNEKERIFKPVEITDQPFWMQEKSRFSHPFIDSGLHWYKIKTNVDSFVNYKAGWLKNNGDWMVINLFTGDIEFSHNFQIVNIESAIQALQEFSGDSLMNSN